MLIQAAAVLGFIVEVNHWQYLTSVSATACTTATLFHVLCKMKAMLRPYLMF